MGDVENIFVVQDFFDYFDGNGKVFVVQVEGYVL